MKSILLASLVLFVSLALCSCNRLNGNIKKSPVSSYITAKEFIGTTEEFGEYKTLFVSREQFEGTDEEFNSYVAVANDPRMQKGYFQKRKEEIEAAKQVKELVPHPKTLKAGAYPRESGDILVTDEPNSGSAYFAGHAAIVQSYDYTTESFLTERYGKPSGVQRHKNDWYNRYPGYNVYGLIPIYSSPVQNSAAGSWADSKRGLSYNVNLWNYNQDNSFYCSQLPYRAYKMIAGQDISNGASGGWVSPLDLYNSPKTYLFYRR